ncbi:MAG TPA: hypothetical protein VHO02_07805 [Fibrobacteria bacterium]|nr:hypothetical protein [Fibrobacteria bacterium]
MPLVPLALLVFVLQGAFMAVDEFGFHQRRSVPRWERIGHPLDTLTVLAPLLIAILLPPTAMWMAIFVGGAAFSCLFITKDEWVHARYCVPGEQWLHAVLFVLHPVLFLAMFLLWMTDDTKWLILQAILVSTFFLWQTLYWNGPWAPKAAKP